MIQKLGIFLMQYCKIPLLYTFHQKEFISYTFAKRTCQVQIYDSSNIWLSYILNVRDCAASFWVEGLFLALLSLLNYFLFWFISTFAKKWGGWRGAKTSPSPSPCMVLACKISLEKKNIKSWTCSTLFFLCFPCLWWGPLSLLTDSSKKS